MAKRKKKLIFEKLVVCRYMSDQADVQRLYKILTFHNKTLFRHRIANLEYVSGLVLVDFTRNEIL